MLLADIRAGSGAMIVGRPDGILKVTIPGMFKERTIGGLTSIVFSCPGTG